MATRPYEFRSEFMRKAAQAGYEAGFEPGYREGLGRGLLAALQGRNVDLSDDAKARITSCADTEQLNVWIRRAATATRIEDVLD